ncbi:MAG: S-layer protein [Candidatus Anstonellales archaeon]
MFEKFSTRLFIRINRVMGPVHRQVLLDPSKDFGDAGKGESMKLNLKKIGAIVAGATILASSVAFAGVMYGNTVLVNDNGQPLAKVIVGEKAAASDGVGAAKIVAKLANNAYATKTLKASATATCTGGAGTGTCDVSQETTTLEVTIPGLGTGVHNFGLLIDDFMDRELENRWYQGNADLYTYQKDLLNEKGTPYQDQIGGLLFNAGSFSNVGGGAAAYKISGDNFVPFSKVSVQAGAGRTSNWVEYQFAWFSGYSNMGDKNDEVAPSIDTGLYALVFAPGDNGLPLCPGDPGKSYWYECAVTDQIEAYRMQIKFLGENWVISDVEPPVSTTAVLSDKEVYREAGTIIKLAKEATYGIVDVGDCLTWEEKGVKVCLDDISTLETVKPAIVSFRDLQDKIITSPDGNPIKDQIAPGQTKKVYVPGYGDIKVHVYQTAPGYGLLAKWAEFAIYADEIELESGKKFIESDDTDWKVLFGWSDKYGTTAPKNTYDYATHLREIVLYNEQELEDMTKGEAYPVIDLKDYQGYELVYNGLEAVDRDTLKFKMDNSYTGPLGGKEFKGDGVSSWGDCAAGTSVVLSGAVEVWSDKEKLTPAFTNAAGFSDAEKIFVIYDAADIAADTCGLASPGDVIIMDENGNYQFVDYAAHDVVGTSVNSLPFEYDYAGDEGRVVIYDPTNSNSGLVELYLTEDIGAWDDPVNGGSDLVDVVGVIADPSVIGTKDSFLGVFGAPPDDDEVGFMVVRDGDNPLDSFINNPTGYDNNNGWVDGQDYQTDFITLRGTYAKKTGKNRDFSVASKPVHALFTFRPVVMAGVNPDTFTCEKIPEGGTCNVGNVSIKVKSIDEVVAPCSVSGGACAVESVNAQIVDENNQAMGAEVKASVPYTLTSNLMYLDTEATGLGTGVVITVGGQAVNTVTAAALEEAGMTIDSTNNVVVKEVGNKIIVAGYTAEDTLAAVDQFLAGVKRQ